MGIVFVNIAVYDQMGETKIEKKSGRYVDWLKVKVASQQMFLIDWK